MNQGLYDFPPIQSPQQNPLRVAFAVIDLSNADPTNIQYFYPATNKYYDLNNDYDLSKQGFIAPVNGIYQFKWSCYSVWGIRACLYVNGGVFAHVCNTVTSLSASWLCNKGDFIQLGGWYGEWGNRLIYPSFAGHNLFTGSLIREL